MSFTWSSVHEVGTYVCIYEIDGMLFVQSIIW